MLFPAPLVGQDAAERAGAWWGVGVGGGVEWILCDICETRPRPGIAGHGRLGTTISRRLLVGLELGLWTRGEEGARHFLASLAATGHWYPRSDGSLFIKAGFAAVGLRADGEGDALTALDPGGLIGVGLDRRLGAGMSLVPFAQLLVAPAANLTLGGATAARNVVLALLQAGVGVRWH